MSASILTAAALCSVGTSAVDVFTSVRAGITRLRETSVCDREFEPVVMGLVPDRYLASLAPALDAKVSMSARQRRMVCLVDSAWRELAAQVAHTASIPLYLGAPDTPAGRPTVVAEPFLDDLAVQCEGAFDRGRSRLFAEGRAAVFVALEHALRDLDAGLIDQAWVGGVDTYLDLWTLATLDRDERLKTTQRMEGFRPGEGAVVVLLERTLGWCDVVSVGNALEAGHLHSEAPLRGDGLSDAVRSALGGSTNVGTVLSGMNGEYLGAKEWGVAVRRNHRALAQDAITVCPAEHHGDAGAATGALLLALGAVGLARGVYSRNVLAWAASDHAPRGAA